MQKLQPNSQKHGCCQKIAQQQDIKQAQRCVLCTFNKTIAMTSKRMEKVIQN